MEREKTMRVMKCVKMLQYIPGDSDIPEGCANDVLEELSK